MRARVIATEQPRPLRGVVEVVELTGDGLAKDIADAWLLIFDEARRSGGFDDRTPVRAAASMAASIATATARAIAPHLSAAPAA